MTPLASATMLVAAFALAAGDGQPPACTLPSAKGFACVPGFCAAWPGAKPPAPRCLGVELRLGGGGTADGRVAAAAAWCSARANCTAFAIDPAFAVTLAFGASNYTAAAQPNFQWQLFVRGDAPPPLPPTPAPPTPGPVPPALPVRCATDTDCSLNGRCDAATGVCACSPSWTGRNCEALALRPVPSPPTAYGYGMAPNVTSWGGSIWHDRNGSTGSAYHLFVTEETGGKGLASWVTNSQIVHAVADSPLGPFTRKSVVSTPPTTNPQLLFDESTSTFLLFHIRGGGSFQLYTSRSVDGPFNATDFAVKSCNNPTAAFHPNGTLFVMCHDAHFSLHALHPNATTPAWRAAAAPPITTLSVGHSAHVPGNCEDPFIWFDADGHFHALAHCYTCYWYPASTRPGSTGGGSCLPGSAFCSGHGFSATGEAGNWTWVGGPQAAYNFTSAVEGGGVRAFSTRERPWALLGGESGADIVALINGVSPAMPTYNKFTAGKDWCFTNIQGVGPEPSN